jgi:hypothetical protein
MRIVLDFYLFSDENPFGFSRWDRIDVKPVDKFPSTSLCDSSSEISKSCACSTCRKSSHAAWVVVKIMTAELQ